MDLKITELKQINNKLKEKFEIDSKDFASFSYKRGIERVINQLGISDVNSLISGLESGNISKDLFLHYMSIPETGMFRDGNTWRKIKQVLQNDISKSTSKYKIYLPAATTGDEYFSLLIILYQEKLIDKVEINVSSWSDKTLENIQTAYYNSKLLEAHMSNYKRFEGKKDFEIYYNPVNNGASFKHLIKNTLFEKKALLLKNDNLSRKYNLIIFRNKLIYLSNQGQEKILMKLKDCMNVSGKIVFGLGENIYATPEAKKYFLPVYEQEHIYKKNI